MRRRIFRVLSLGIALLSPSILPRMSPVFAGGGIIYPGKGVDDIRIGEKLSPREEAGLKKSGVTVTRRGGGQVASLRLSQPTFSVAVSLVRIKQSGIADVVRFYGKRDSELKPGRIILRYPEQGIDFEIDQVNDRVEAITVYSPVSPKFSIEQYQQRRELLQPKK